MTVRALCHMLRVLLTSIIRSHGIDDVHKAILTLWISVRVWQDNCTLVASAGSVELGQDGRKGSL